MKTRSWAGGRDAGGGGEGERETGSPLQGGVEPASSQPRAGRGARGKARQVTQRQNRTTLTQGGVTLSSLSRLLFKNLKKIKRYLKGQASVFWKGEQEK